MEQLITTIVSLPPELVITLAGGFVSVAIQGIKKWLDLQSPKVILTLTATLSTLVTVLPVLITSLTANPTLLGQYTLGVVGAATLLYRYAVQPMSHVLSDYTEFRRLRSTETQTIPTDLTAAAPVAPVIAPQLTATPAPVAPTSTNEFIG